MRWKQSKTQRENEKHTNCEKNCVMLNDVMFISFWCLCYLSLRADILFASFKDRLFVRAKEYFDMYL